MNNLEFANNTDLGDAAIVKVMACERSLTWVSPPENQVFHLAADGALPDLVFEFYTDRVCDYQWSWNIQWQARSSGLRERARTGQVLNVFNESGAFVSREMAWSLDFGGKVLGGTLTVMVTVGHQTLTRTVIIKGRNPSRDNVAEYVASLENASGLDRLLEQETRTRHFIEHDGEPIVSFDQGYGITQMTNPAPSYDQVWNWKANILGGSLIFRDKQRAAKRYLEQGGRTFTQDQLQHETLSRWNGGTYHQWDAASSSWVRRENILCDTSTGNIGWPMDNANNQGKSETQLHERDKDTYQQGSAGQSAEHPWEYKGVCYADHVLE